MPLLGFSENDIHEITDALVYGFKNFCRQKNISKILIGLSGGIDSSVVAALATAALGPEAIYGITMPTSFNTQTTLNIARAVAKNLNIAFTEVPITPVVSSVTALLEKTCFKKNGISITPILSDLARQNIQARIRSADVLAGLASGLGAVFTCNGNKTEMALGYATLYGDIGGALAPLGDLWKTQVYLVGHELNRRFLEKENTAPLPDAVFTLKPSAELSDDQNPEKNQGDPIHYAYHDFVLRQFVEFRKDPAEILEKYDDGTLAEFLGIDAKIILDFLPNRNAFKEDLEKLWRLYKSAIFKRIQSPPILTVSKRAFGFDLREAQNGAYETIK